MKFADDAVKDLVDGPGGIRALLEKAMKEGKSVGQMAEQFSVHFEEIERWKIDRIVRSQPAMAYNEGRIETSKKAGVKKWWILLGSDPCDWCEKKAAECGSGKPEAWINAWLEAHHPFQDCSIVPVVDIDVSEPVFAPEIPEPTQSAKARIINIATRQEKKIIASDIVAPSKWDKEFSKVVSDKYGVEITRAGYNKEKAQKCIDIINSIQGKMNPELVGRLRETKCLVNVHRKLGSRLGQYDYANKQMSINRALSFGTDIKDIKYYRNSFEWSTGHEYGHHAFTHGGFTSEQKKVWSALWEKNKNKGISEYFGASYEEGFCEAYSSYINKAELLKEKNPEIYKWFTKYVFGL
jgi:hypothetical protein